MIEKPEVKEERTPLVRVEDVSFKYPVSDRPALENVSFSIYPGEFIGVMGPSGAGKTTLSLILKGLAPYSVAGQLTGKVFFDGVELTVNNVRDLTKRVGFVFQDPEMQIIGLTVEEDLAWGPENYQWESKRIQERIAPTLKVVRMDGLALRETWGLSGGQKQRVAIASALILEPDILILDEPTSELDPIGKAEVFETINRLKKEKNMTVFMVEHEVEELAEMSDRILLFNEGHLMAQGTPNEVFRQVDVFHQIGGERVPHIAEILSQMQTNGYLRPDQFSVNEAAGIELIKEQLENHK
jgi:energy-coupling factor transporter ATP-binding protein EcfA2